MTETNDICVESKHYVLDIKNVSSEKFLNGDEYIKLFSKIIKENCGTIVNTCFYNFSPYGTTVVLLLAESHLSIHTWPEKNHASLDIYTCGNTIKTKEIIETIISWFSSSSYVLQYVPRLSVNNTIPSKISCTDLKITKQLADVESEYQHIQLFETDSFGKLLVLDGIVQLTESKAQYYNEMMAHIPMCSHPNPEKVLIIGGGDGYILNEILKYKSVKEVYLVDIDKEIIDLSKKYFDKWNKCYQDPRLHLIIGDGAEFCSSFCNEFFDVIIQDSSDPFNTDDLIDKTTLLSSNTLFSQNHFAQIKRILDPNGIAIIQSECFHNMKQFIKELIKINEKLWKLKPKYGLIYEPTYPFGTLGFLVLSDAIDAAQPIKTIPFETKVYNSDYHMAAFALPTEFKELFY